MKQRILEHIEGFIAFMILILAFLIIVGYFGLSIYASVKYRNVPVYQVPYWVHLINGGK